MFCHPRVLQSLNKLKEVSGGTKPTMLDSAGSGADGPRRSIFGIPVFATSALSITETQGTSTDCASAYVVQADQLVAVRRQEVIVEVDCSRLFDSDSIAVRATARWDLVVPNPSAIVRIVGIRPAGPGATPAGRERRHRTPPHPLNGAPNAPDTSDTVEPRAIVLGLVVDDADPVMLDVPIADGTLVRVRTPAPALRAAALSAAGAARDAAASAADTLALLAEERQRVAEHVIATWRDWLPEIAPDYTARAAGGIDAAALASALAAALKELPAPTVNVSPRVVLEQEPRTIEIERDADGRIIAAVAS